MAAAVAVGVPQEQKDTIVVKYNTNDDDEILYDAMKRRADKLLSDENNVLVMINTECNYGTFHSSLVNTQVYHRWNCFVCREFVNAYGAKLGVFNKLSGKICSLFWDASDPHLQKTVFLEPISAMDRAFLKKPIERLYKPSSKTIGLSHSGGYTHMVYRFPDRVLKDLDIHDLEANVDRHSFELLLKETTVADAHKLLSLFTDHAFSKVDKYKPIAEIILNAVKAIDGIMKSKSLESKSQDQDPSKSILDRLGQDFAKRHDYEVVVSAAVRGLGLGASHLRSSVLGKLLLCIREGDCVEKMKATWDFMTSGEHYMRPTAAPSIQQLNSLKKEFADKGYKEDDLAMDFVYDDKHDMGGIDPKFVLWRSTFHRTAFYKHQAQAQDKAAQPSPFDKVTPKPQVKEDSNPLIANGPTATNTEYQISWEKFLTSVMPNAERMDYWIPQFPAAVYLTRNKPGSRAMLRWQIGERADINPFSHFVWVKTRPSMVCLGMPEGTWRSITFVAPLPYLWRLDSPLQPEVEEREQSKDETKSTLPILIAQDSNVSDEKQSQNAKQKPLMTEVELKQHHDKLASDMGKDRFILALHDIADIDPPSVPNPLFPEFLKPKWFEYRQAIESYNRETQMKIKPSVLAERGVNHATKHCPLVAGIEIRVESSNTGQLNCIHKIRVQSKDGAIKVYSISIAG